LSNLKAVNLSRHRCHLYHQQKFIKKKALQDINRSMAMEGSPLQCLSPKFLNARPQPIKTDKFWFPPHQAQTIRSQKRFSGQRGESSVVERNALRSIINLLVSNS
jgi:hypothetical protein